MRIGYTYLIDWCAFIFIVLVASWLGYHLVDACKSCFLRVSHAIRVRDKMRRCIQSNYKKFSAAHILSVEVGDTIEEEGVIWLPVCAEPYGPQRQIKKRQRAVPLQHRKRLRSKVIHDDAHTDLVAHRAAPFSLPLAKGSFWMSSRFGPRPRADGSAGFHYGIDLAANRGTPVYAARSGVILYAGHDNGYGKTVVIKHGSHFKTRYAHLDKILVKTGDTIARGSAIGAVGATGHVRKKGGDGSHLHFEVYYQGKRVDPLQFLPDFVS